MLKQCGEWDIKLKNEEFMKLKNRVAFQAISKIILYSFIAMLVLEVMVDGILNDEIANRVADMNISLYYWCIQNKVILIGIAFISIFFMISFLVIRNLNNNMVEILTAMDQILKEPEKEVKLSNQLLILQSRLNNIRVDLIKSQNEAKEAMQKKNDLIMYMAHDLKTPLTSIIGYLTLLTQEKEISKELTEKYMGIALEKALRVEDLTNQFFDITRYNLQSMPIIKQSLDIVFLIEQLVEEVYPMLQEKSLKCKITKPECIFFMGDGDKLARAFGNLIKNAISYSYEDTTIEIELKEESDKIKLDFKNRGDKIPPYKLEKIFDKFYRADSSRTSSTGGAGLGLAITKQIIELHKGSIGVRNEGDWIIFHIELNRSY